MEVPHQLSEQDFVDAYTIHRKRMAGSNWIVRIMLLFVVIMAVAAFGGAIADPKQRTLTNLWPIPPLLVLWFFVLRIYPRWNMRRQFRNQPGVQGPRAVTFDAAGAHWRWGGGSSEIAWKNYIRWIEGDKQILLYSSPVYFDVVPKRALDSGQLAELRELLKTNIVTAKK